MHLSPDAPAVGVLADLDSTPNDEALKPAQNLSFAESCLINNIPAPVEFTLSVVANGDNEFIAEQFSFASTINGAATAVVSGFLMTGLPAITTLPLPVSPRSVFTRGDNLNQPARIGFGLFTDRMLLLG